jgi:hypothetical protein
MAKERMKVADNVSLSELLGFRQNPWESNCVNSIPSPAMCEVSVKNESILFRQPKTIYIVSYAPAVTKF